MPGVWKKWISQSWANSLARTMHDDFDSKKAH